MEREIEDDILSDFFRFPIVMADGNVEEGRRRKKERFGDMTNSSSDEDDDMETTIGEAEYPYTYFMGVSDRWLPTRDSFMKAKNDFDFEACYVTFANIGSFIVPWTKERWKKEFSDFVKEFREKEAARKKALEPRTQASQQGTMVPILRILSQEEVNKLKDGDGN